MYRNSCGTWGRHCGCSRGQRHRSLRHAVSSRKWWNKWHQGSRPCRGWAKWWRLFGKVRISHHHEHRRSKIVQANLYFARTESINYKAFGCKRGLSRSWKFYEMVIYAKAVKALTAMFQSRRYSNMKHYNIRTILQQNRNIMGTELLKPQMKTKDASLIRGILDFSDNKYRQTWLRWTMDARPLFLSDYEYMILQLEQRAQFAGKLRAVRIWMTGSTCRGKHAWISENTQVKHYNWLEHYILQCSINKFAVKSTLVLTSSVTKYFTLEILLRSKSKRKMFVMMVTIYE